MKEHVNLYLEVYKVELQIDSGGGLVSENEENTVLETSLIEALQMIENQEIIDARTIMLLYYLKIQLLQE
jgi:hypothetical protein